ncbi:efflux transporter periplasmic adaptor subunit [Pseudomonas syringae pv. tomato]|uniref:Efflux RND transporter periplasmic adaptor subunit n=11 Tax=Pseudomonas syringae group TaxID=136849 RepID=A0AAW4DVR5_PSESX|nr:MULTISPECIES: efflux RND transporter periplasmic adaptor subunit [Pseudomonas]KPC11654.1 Cation efflux family protein [Pseudomonas amygdali pv. lachrymans]AAO53920.1 cation efflux family protein [Pseudomonas syringae pv. tomato str. DC3000]AVI82629.1 efflux transporter periplasmic adaptor subunit [Pseudomonas syringae pv. tomato]EEB61174.1 cation efflux family protein [Pseudomonas syringae pv. tomato T1]EGH94968.1 cation efflux family protein [Pseudomonas amygdali pv. lachrymans str. M30227
MNNKRSIAIALAVVVIIGLGSLTVSQQMLPFAAETDASDKKPADKEHGHESEDAHGDDDHASDPKKASAAAAEQPHEEEEEGHIELTAEQIKTAGIELATAEPRQMSTTVTFPGEIRFDEDRTAHVVPRVSGVVESVKVDLGQAVKKGQVLAVIASQQISDQRSELNAAQRRQELARLTLQREKKLWEDKISAEQDYLQARQDFQEADINLANARQKISAIGASLSPSAGNRYELIAPFDSMVVEKHLGIGEMVNEASNAFTLSDLSRVWATFGVAPRDLDKVVVGRPVIVSAPDLNARVEGKIGYVGSLLGEQTRAAAVRVTLANPQGAWRPGLFVSVEVAAEQSSVAVSVPDSAIQSIEEKPSVFVRNAEGFQLTPVTLGRRDGGHVEIVKGLAAGTQVAAAGSFILKSELGKGSAEHAH